MDADTGMDPLYCSHMGVHGLCRSHNKAYTGKYSSAHLPDLVFLNLNKKGDWYTDSASGCGTRIRTDTASCSSRIAVGFLIGMAAGFGLALLMKLSGIVEKLAFPYLMLIQLIPILGMAPIILSLTGSIGVSRIVIAAILTFYPVAANTLAGLKSVQQEKYELMYSYAANRRTIYKKVLIPSCIPYFFTGLKIAAPMAITASILVDTLQGDGGLGCMLSQSLKHAMSIYVFWDIVLVSAVIGVLSAKIMGWLELAISPLKRIDRKIKGKGNGK